MFEPILTDLTIVESRPDSPEAAGVLDTLSNELLQRFANDGRQSYSDWCPGDPQHLFVLAKCGEETVGCGAIRPVAPGIGEVKRMFAKYRQRGIGTAILRHLEKQAVIRKYQWLWLETRAANREAISFYTSHQYSVRENFGKYVGNPLAVCFEKRIET